MMPHTSMAVRAVRGALQGVEPGGQRRAVAQRLLGRRVAVVVKSLARLAEQRIVGGDDIFDLGAVLGLQQRDRVDQNRLVGDQLAGGVEFRQCRARFHALLEHGLGLDVPGWRKRRQVVVGLVGRRWLVGAGASSYVHNTPFGEHIIVDLRMA